MIRICILCLALFLAAPAHAAAAGGPAPVKSAQTAHRGDLDLYLATASAIRSGENYYEASGRLDKARHYPTSPFFAVRTPVLAYADAALGETGLRVLACFLMLAACAMWARKLSPVRAGIAWFAILGVDLPLIFGPFIHFHDLWAGLLLACALGVEGKARVAFAFVAAAVRVLTAPFLGLLVLTGPRRPAIVALCVFVALLFVHAMLIHNTGTRSQGWHGGSGLAAMWTNAQRLSVGQFLPSWIFAPLLILPALGWLHDRQAMLWFGWFIAFVFVFARPDNSYWLVNIAPSWFIGLAMLRWPHSHPKPVCAASGR